MKKYIIQKIVEAASISKALKLEKDVKPEAIWLKGEKAVEPVDAIGYLVSKKEEDEE